jgi:thioredoxin-like negative regulator of GroEL
MMKHFIKNMSKEEKQKLMQAYMESLSEEEKAEMIQLMMPIMMKDMKPATIMPVMIKNFNEGDCKKMITEMPPETRQKCKKMMIQCLQALEQIETTPH